MDPSLPLQLFLQEDIDHSVPCGLHLRLEGFRGDDEAEVCLSRYAAFHGLVVGVLARVVVDLEGRWLQGLIYLMQAGQPYAVEAKMPPYLHAHSILDRSRRHRRHLPRRSEGAGPKHW